MFSKKSDRTENTVQPLLNAELMTASALPTTAPSEGTTIGCHKAQVGGTSGQPVLTQYESGQVPETAFIVERPAGGEPVAIVNSQEFRFDLWRLASSDDWTATAQIPLDGLQPEPGAWRGYFALNAACVTDNIALVAVVYHHPRPSFALYLLDLASLQFEQLANVETDIVDLDKLFEIQRISDDESVILYFDDKRRQSAEIYNNYYNHFVLFSSKHPRGLPLLKLGIDTGNVREWRVDDGTLFFRTSDNRDLKQRNEQILSLDISRVLRSQETN